MMARKKIGLFLECEPHVGGGFQYNQIMLDAVAALPEDRFSVVVCYTSELWLDLLRPYNVRTIFVPKGFWGRLFCLAWTWLSLPMSLWRLICPFFHPMAKGLLQEECDLWIFPAQDARSFQIPVPALVSIHDIMYRYEHFPEVLEEYRSKEYNYGNICRWARGVLVDSQIGRQQVMESFGIAGERVHILPFTAPKYIYTTTEPEGFASRYQLPPKFIFYPAQFWEHKNHKRLVSAIGTLKSDLPDLKLVLAGSRKNAFESVVRLVDELRLSADVVFLGYVPDEDIPEIYRRARAMVMPSLLGPTFIPPLEGFVVGTPVAISNCYAIPEQVGDAALLFNPESVEEIADCIRRLWTDDRLCADLVRKGRERAARWGQREFNGRLREIVEEIVLR
jgi:glycosyltransferase involved in cell wall biosynthesis